MTTPTGRKLLTVLNRLTGQKVAVFGDIMLDQYTWGDVSRISPEAPIPVVNVTQTEYRNGGAASAACNLAALGCDTDLYGIAGTDPHADTLTAGLQTYRVCTDQILYRDYFPTIVKNRVLTHRQQLLRIDYERSTELTSKDEADVIRAFEAKISQYRAVLLSDYRKGFLTPGLTRAVIEICRAHNVPVVVDPGRGVPPETYAGATALKPNRSEASHITGKIIDSPDDALEAAAKIVSLANADFITLSLDKDGVLLYHKNGGHTFYSAQQHEVYDVTGAGDTFAAVLTAFLADGFPAEVSSCLANIAAGESVTHMGRHPAGTQEYFSGNQDVSPEDIRDARAHYRFPLPLVFISDTFDNPSAGFINAVSRFEGDLTVAVTTDEAIYRASGAYPKINQELRLRLLSGFDFISWLVLTDDADPSGLIRMLRPDTVIMRQQSGAPGKELADALNEVQAKVEYID
ncbi:hypothetical protein CHS0354_018363 [Potamilus streckersoni]|uniref:Carbohydrate kinase PfkB domain-containing protein n=1 Tax=Potamilus streckersoni TaxID=2493646 RepID=A0AAE0TBG2_9BIVA|nr:hypothetical protein CHS0354_018363 [Potamilus streckersoni]